MGNNQAKNKKPRKGRSATTSSAVETPPKNRETESFGIDPEVIRDIQKQTNFDKVEVKKLYEVFSEIAPNGTVDEPTFKKALGKLQQCGLNNLEDTPFGERLFHLLDTNGDNVVDLQEFICGLSLLCKGTLEEKLALSFKAYDLDGNGYITKDELALMFKSAWLAGFKALCTTHANEEVNMEDLNEFSEEMASLFAENAFETLDANSDGKLSFEEFKEFAMAEPKITATLNGFKKEVNITFF